MYWTDRYINRVIRANKWHGGNQTVMLYNVPQPMGLVAMHAVRQPAGTFLNIFHRICNLSIFTGIYGIICIISYKLVTCVFSFSLHR